MKTLVYMEEYSPMNTSKVKINDLFSSQMSNGKKGFSVKIIKKPTKDNKSTNKEKNNG